MKGLTIFLLILFLINKLVAQSGSALYGFVLEQNSGKKPVPGVLVKALFANQVLSGDKGAYTLNFQNAKPGKNVVLTVKKEAWVSINKTDIEVNLPEDPFKNPYNIVMCREEKWNQQVQTNRSVIKQSLERSLQKAVTKLNIANRQDQLRLDSLEQYYQRQEKELSPLAEAMSRINLDDVSVVEQQAYQLFQEGKIDECRRLRESLQSEKAFKQARLQGNRIDSMKQKVSIARQANDSILAFNRRNLRELATLSQFQLNAAKADERYKFLAVNDSDNYVSLFAYAQFLYQQNRYEQAIQWAGKALNHATSVPQECNARLLLSDAHLLLNKFSATEQDLQQVLATFQQGQNPTIGATYQLFICQAQASLGKLYYYQKKDDAAEKAYTIALEICQQPDNVNLPTYQPLLASIQNGLGVLYTEHKKYTAAESALKEAVNKYVQLAADNSAAYDLYVIVASINLGTLYMSQINFAPAEQIYREALSRYEKMIKDQPNAGLTTGAEGLFTEKYDIALIEQAFQKATFIILQIAKEGSAAYEKQASDMLLKYLNGYAFAERTFKSAMAIYQQLAKSNPEVYEPYLADMLGVMGSLYIGKGEFVNAEKVIQESLGKKKQLAQHNPAVYQPQVIATQLNLGAAYTGENELEAAEKIYWETLDFCTAGKARMPEVYIPLFYNTIISMGEFYKGYYHTKKLVEYKAMLGQITLEAQEYTEENIRRKLQSEQQFFGRRDVDAEILTGQRKRATSSTERIRLQQEALRKRKMLVDSGLTEFTNILAGDYAALSWQLTLGKQYAAAEQIAREGMKYKPQTNMLIVNIAPAILLQENKYEEAKAWYLLWKDKPSGNNKTFKKAFLSDLQTLSDSGITHPNIDSIRVILNQP